MSLRSERLAALGVSIALALALGTSRAVAQAPNGAAVYMQHCRACHGARGVPAQRMLTLFPKIKTLADSAFMATLSTDSIATVVRKGAGSMTGFGGKLSADEIKAVAAYVKTLPEKAGAP
jgi:cytochrome c6